MVNRVISIILIHLVFNSFCQECPDPDLISPCTCVDQKTFDGYKTLSKEERWYVRDIKPGFSCVGGEEYFYLSKIFEEIDEKYEGSKELGRLKIKELEITELEENTFHNFTFEKLISITECNDLININENAFTETSNVTKQIIILGNPKLNSQSLFKVLNKFTAVQTIELSYNDLVEIPNEAFTNNLAHLRRLVINEPKIITLGQLAFKGLANIKHLEITGTQIDFIPDFAFEIQESSKYPLFIKLNKNKLTTNSFAPNAFANIGRPTMLHLRNQMINTERGYDLEYFNKTVFLPFLQDDPLNKINMVGQNNFDCLTCKNYWIKSNNLMDRLFRLTCSNKLKIETENQGFNYFSNSDSSTYQDYKNFALCKDAE